MQYLEHAAWAHTVHLGLGWDSYEELCCGVVAHRTEIDYLQAAVLGDELEVGTWCSGNGGKLRLKPNYQMRRPRDGTSIVHAKTQWI